MVQSFVFSPFQENTYVITDEATREAVVIDPGCYTQLEKATLAQFITAQNLTIRYLLLTHAHLDHVFGAAFVKRKFGVEMYLNDKDLPILADVPNRCHLWNIPGYEPVERDHNLAEGDVIKFGNTELTVVETPGHAPGHVAFINHAERYIIGGDVLFKNSIGRTDFPFCDHAALLNSIQTKFYTLPDDYTVYAGHMEPTTIGQEKQNNPFTK
jgi:hydroxyacylglutathione hydrolase